jgi:hypothetical protein
MNTVDNPGNSAETPFVYFVSGTPAYPPNTVYQCAREVLETKSDFREALKNRIEEGFVGGILTVLPHSWWFHFLLQYIDYFRNNFSEPKEMETSAIEILRLIIEARPSEAWSLILQLVIKDIDNLSGWSKSWIKESAEQRNVTKGHDGNYYCKDFNGTLIQIVGATTTPETHIDFITDQILRGYGCLRQIFNVFSVFAIADEFVEHRSSFPRSLKAVLEEPKFQNTSHRWQLMQYERTRSIRWRPLSNFCDPEWLAGDMLARITDTLDRDAWQQRLEKYGTTPSRLDHDCKWQTDYVLDSVISVGKEEEIYFKFENRTFRWINGTAESRALISVGVNELGNHKAEDESLNRLLSVLVWEHRQPIVKRDGIGGPKRPLPLTWGSRSSFGLQIDPQYLFGKTGIYSDERWLALALYKEGVNSSSVFYRFLNFWKILEVALKNKNDRWRWINLEAPNLSLHTDRIKQITTINADIAEYLDYSGRCAIAHVFRRPIVNPDDYEDYVRISQDVRIVEELARKAVNQFLPLI